MRVKNCSSGFTDLEVQAMIGIYENELMGRQKLLISLEMNYPPQAASAFLENDEITLALDYQSAADLVCSILSCNRFGLLEHLCAVLSEKIIDRFPLVSSIRIEAKKPGAVAGSRGSFCILEAEPGSG